MPELTPLVFVRANELIRAEWAEINLKAAEWRIPAERIKMKQIHIVPLSRQTLAIFQELHEKNGNGRFVFPGNQAGNDGPMLQGEARYMCCVNLAALPTNIPFTASEQWHPRS